MSLAPKLTVLAVTANPSDTSPLRTDQLFMAIQQGIRKAEQSNTIQVIPSLASDLDQFFRDLEMYKPKVLHLIGHGYELSEFVFEKPDGTRQLIDTDEFANHLAVYARHVECIIISACKSYSLAHKLKKRGIKIALGIEKNLNRDIAEHFIREFYFYVARGNSIANAWGLTKSNLRTEYDIPDSRLPHLFTAYQNYALFDPGDHDIIEGLKRGSLRKFEAICDKLTISLDETSELDEIKTADLIGQVKPLEESLDLCWNDNHSSLLLIGRQDCGKTLSCLNLWDRYNKELNTPTVLYIPCEEVENYEEEVNPLPGDKILMHYLLRNYLEQPFPSQESYQELYRAFKSSTVARSFLLVLDGFLDLGNTRKKVFNNLKQFWTTRDANNLQVMLTSRSNLPKQFTLPSLRPFHLKEIKIQSIPDSHEPPSPSPLVVDPVSVLVISTNQSGIEEKYQDQPSVLSNIPEERYHQYTTQDWRPFLDQPNIQEILQQVEKRCLIPFTTQYTEPKISSKDHLEIRKNLKRTIGILDLLGLTKHNRRTARLFDLPNDAHEVGGVITPICNKSVDELLMAPIAEELNEVLFNLELLMEENTEQEYDFLLDFYGRNNPDVTSFINQLCSILETRFDTTIHHDNDDDELPTIDNLF